MIEAQIAVDLNASPGNDFPSLIPRKLRHATPQQARQRLSDFVILNVKYLAAVFLHGTAQCTSENPRRTGFQPVSRLVVLSPADASARPPRAQKNWATLYVARRRRTGFQPVSRHAARSPATAHARLSRAQKTGPTSME